jgi:hypothetical protein
MARSMRKRKPKRIPTKELRAKALPGLALRVSLPPDEVLKAVKAALQEDPVNAARHRQEQEQEARRVIDRTLAAEIYGPATLKQPTKLTEPAASARALAEPKDWIVDAIKRRKPGERVTDFARRVAPEIAAAHRADAVRRAWGLRTIVTRIGEYKLWPK